MRNGEDLFQHILVNLNDDFDAYEKRAIAKSILFDIAHFTIPWSAETNISDELILEIREKIKNDQ